MSAAEEIVINRLSLKAEKRDINACISSLETSAWSIPNEQRWMFVRQLNFSCLKDELRFTASQTLSQMMASAVDGRNPSASNAQAVYFDSLPLLLAYLLNDIFNGQLNTNWYWSRWRYLERESKSNAIAMVFFENVEHLTSICRQLVQLDAIKPIWLSLSEQASLQLITRLHSSTSNAYQRTSKSRRSQGKIAGSSGRFLNRMLSIESQLIDAWKKVVVTLSPIDARVRLAAKIISLQIAPKLWCDRPEDVETFVVNLLKDDKTKSKAKKPVSIRPSEQLLISGKAQQSRLYTPQSGHEIADLARNTDTSKVKVIEENRERFSKSVSQSSYTQRNNQTAKEPIRLSRPEELAELPQSQSEKDTHYLPERTKTQNQNLEQIARRTLAIGESGTSEFQTAWGGLFYLVNLLRLDDCQKIIREDLESVSGWYWLLDLARLVSAELDKPLLFFIAAQLGEEKVEPLVARKPSVVMTELLQSLKNKPHLKAVINTELLNVPAKIIASDSHIDCYFSASSVRLEIRMLGLDINPGWVEWLGRVVTFHYLEGRDVESNRSGKKA